MSLITSLVHHNPVEHYALVDRKTSVRPQAVAGSRMNSVSRSYGFKWKGLGIEYSSQDIHVSSPGRLTKNFVHDLREARQIRSLPCRHDQRHPGPIQPGPVSKAYIRQMEASLEPMRPMISVSV